MWLAPGMSSQQVAAIQPYDSSRRFQNTGDMQGRCALYMRLLVTAVCLQCSCALRAALPPSTDADSASDALQWLRAMATGSGPLPELDWGALATAAGLQLPARRTPALRRSVIARPPEACHISLLEATLQRRFACLNHKA